MQRVDTFQLYTLATRLRKLAELTKESTVRKSVSVFFFAEIELEKLLKNEVVPLRVARPSVSELVKVINELTDGLGDSETDQAEFDAPLDWKAGRLASLVTTFEHVLSAELAQLDIYLVPQKSIYSTNELIERSENLFPNDVQERMGPEAVKDIHEAGKCIAFNVPTASGFHITRAVEAVMVRYWELVTGKRREDLSGSQRTMGSLIKLLRDETVDGKILGVLDQIRDMHRNPTMHPDAFFTEPEALALLGVAQSAILMIAADMKRRDPMM